MAVLPDPETSAPAPHRRRAAPTTTTDDWRANATIEGFILESWGQGFMVGALLIMVALTVANMRRRVLLHKLILAELFLAMSHGTFCFMSFEGYGWYLSSTAALYYTSCWIHNLVAWLKIRPFFRGGNAIFSAQTCKKITWVYLISLALSAGPLVFQIYNNFRFFNDLNSTLYPAARPYETLMRDPWWIFVCVMLFRVVRVSYGATTLELLKTSPRFGVLVTAIMLAVVFTVIDIIASVHPTWFGGTNGYLTLDWSYLTAILILHSINPWWKLYLVSKCLTDTIMLDDFKTELDKLSTRFVNKEPTQLSHPATYTSHRERASMSSDNNANPTAMEFLTIADAAGSSPDQEKSKSKMNGSSKDSRKRQADSFQLEDAV
ncbi:uncharacterized protein LTR77_008313 [Saxophila tyrrhenica]|uniref:Uncharacterized protein n=1 Tax=Saxophila tyrrhenica TaxID=1690608 RepID=A0AAV9P3W5_9PEZI|nr:hypothetical protein LTR77_008313 [Saxophila tyrrhenica]